MEQSSVHLRWRDETSESNLGEWTLRAGMISRENTQSRRFYSSNVRSFRADSMSFRSNITISSSTASSPGYNLREKIDPSTYSFTTALRALQERSVNTWECLSPDVALNSKWNEAEKYICNPLSGEVPVECLSSKILNGKSFRNSTTKNRFTMSAPLIYPSHSGFIQTLPSLGDKQQEIYNVPMKEKKGVNMTKNLGVQSTELANVTSTVLISRNIGEISTNILDSGQVKNGFTTFPNAKTEEKEPAVRVLQAEVKTGTSCELEQQSIKVDKEWKNTGKSNIWKRKGQFWCFHLTNVCRRSEEKHKPRKQKNIFPLPC